MEAIRNSNLVQAWLVLVLAAIFGIALAGIQVKLNPIIEANKLQETVEKIPALIMGESKASQIFSQDLDIKSRKIEVESNGISKFYSIYDVWKKDGVLIGHVAKAKGQGYADKIEVLLGLDANNKSVTGLFILDQKETPGLGNRIIEKGFRDQFINKSTEKPLVVVKTGAQKDNEIDGISGATISSRSVTGIVNTIIADTGSELNFNPEKEKDVDKNNQTKRAE